MTKQLFTVVSLFWVLITFAGGEGNSILYKAAEEKDNFEFDLISKLQKTKTGNFLTCNLRLKNTSGEIKFIESIEVKVEIEAINSKNDKKLILNKSFSFNEEWIIAENDYAFYQPLNHSLESNEDYKILKINSCKIEKIDYGIQITEAINEKSCNYKQEAVLGLIESVVVKAHFQKEADHSPGYYKKGLDQNTIGHSVRVHCTLDLDNSSTKTIKLKENITIGVKIGDKYFYKKLKAQKLKGKEKKTENLFSVHFSDKLKTELPKAGLNP